MDISNNLKSLYQTALKDDNKIDSKEFKQIKEEVLKNGGVTPEVKDFIIDIIDNGDFKKGVAREAISFLEENPLIKNQSETENQKQQIKDSSNTTPEENKVDSADNQELKVDKEGYPIDWKKENTFTGTFNMTSETKDGKKNIQGTGNYQGEFQKGHNKIAINSSIDYGKSTSTDSTTNNTQTNLSGDALNADITYSYEMKPQPDTLNWAPYVKFETQGKVSNLSDRSYRLSSGLELTYTDEKRKSDFDLKLGLAKSNTYNVLNSNWDQEAGFETVFKGKQGLGFLSPDNKFLNNIELATDINATRLTSLDGNSGTNVSAFFGARYYVDTDKNTFMEIGKKFEATSNQTESNINRTTMFNVGFKY